MANLEAPPDKALVIAEVCAALENDPEQARKTLAEGYPFKRVIASSRAYTPLECMQTFLNDGFTDRYCGQRLVFPGTLRLLSLQLREQFPFHPHWKMEATHPAYWELFPTIDHVHPVTRGGADAPSNWVTTSQLRNSQKSNWTLDELGWELVPSRSLEDWDGLTRWCLRFLEGHPALSSEPYIRIWAKAARALLR